MINLFLPAPPFREGWAGKKHGLFAKETDSYHEENGDKTALNSLCCLLCNKFSNTKMLNLKFPHARMLSHYYFQQQQMSLFSISPFPSLCGLHLWPSSCLLTNYFVTWMGKTGSLIKDLWWAEMMLVVCSTRYFLNNLWHYMYSPRKTAFLSFRCCCCMMPGLMSTWDIVWRLRQFKRHVTTLPWWHSGGGGGWWCEIRNWQPLYNFSTWFCFWTGDLSNHALNPGAGAQWFQVTYFLRPPTPVLMMKKLWCLRWTHLVCSLTIAGVGLNLALSFAMPLFLGERKGCCRFFCQPLLPSTAMGF